MADTLGPIPPPPRTGYYAEREADLASALLQSVIALSPSADVQPLVAAALRAGWGLTEVHRMIAALRGRADPRDIDQRESNDR